MDGVDVKNAGENGRNTTLPVSGDTRRRVIEAVEMINKKEYGRRLRIDELIAALVPYINPELVKSLQEATLSPMDRLERDHRSYVGEHGPISLNDYHDKRLSGEILPPKKQSFSEVSVE